MAKFPMDLSKFKKVAADEHCTTMKHPTGHEIKLYHKLLSPKMKADLDSLPIASGKKVEPKKMAKGGLVDGDGRSRDNDDKEIAREDLPTPEELEKRIDRHSRPANERPPMTYAGGGPEGDPLPPQQDMGDSRQAPIVINVGQPAPQGMPGAAASMGLTGLQGIAPGEVAGPTPMPPPPSGQMQAAPMPAEQPAAPVESPSVINRLMFPQSFPTPVINGGPQAAPESEKSGGPKAPSDTTPTTGSGGPAMMAAPMLAQAKAPKASDPFGQEIGMLTGAAKAYKSGLNQEAQVAAQQGAAEADALGNAQMTLQAATDAHKAAMDKVTAQREQLMKEFKDGKINPNHFVDNMSTVGKVSTAIGILLGGLGAGFQGHGAENQVMKFVNAQIDRDIDAQKANLGKKQSLLDFNYKQTQNLNDAMMMTKANLLDAAKLQLQEQASKFKGANSQANAAKAGAMFDFEIGKTLGPLYRQRAMMAGLQAINQQTAGAANPADMDARIQAQLSHLRVINPEAAKEVESRYVPGVGVGQGGAIPQETRNVITAKQTLDAAAKDLYHWSEKHSGSLDPATIAEGKTKAAEIQSLYRNSINGGVFKKGEQEFIDQIVDSDPAKFFSNVRVLPKLKEVINSNQMQLNLLKKANALPLSSGQASGGYAPSTFKPAGK